MLKRTINVADLLKYVLPAVLFLSIGHGCTHNMGAGPIKTTATSYAR